MRRLCAALAVLALGLPVPLARADGDPASDVLLAQDVFRPYAPRLSAPVARALDTAVARAKRARWPVKVALIQSGQDLGAYPVLLGKPQRYADLLGVEISFNERPHILTVMAQGFGRKNLGPRAPAILRAIPIDPAASSDGLALAAARAVAALATAAGHPVRLGPLPGPATRAGGAGRAGRAGTSVALYAAPLALLVVVGAGLAVRNRRRGPDGPGGDGPVGGAQPGTPL